MWGDQIFSLGKKRKTYSEITEFVDPRMEMKESEKLEKKSEHCYREWKILQICWEKRKFMKNLKINPIIITKSDKLTRKLAVG